MCIHFSPSIIFCLHVWLVLGKGGGFAVYISNFAVIIYIYIYITAAPGTKASILE